MKVLLLVIVFAAMSPVWNTDAVFTVSLELQGGNCSDQLTLICRHSDVPTDPSWIHNGTAESSQLLNTAFPGTMYTVQTNTEHRVTISGVGNVQALDGYIIQCVYSIRSNLVKSNAIKYSFIPPDYRPALSLVTVTADFSERLCTFNYSYQESCSLYPRCTPHFSVEYTVFPQPAVNISSSGCSVEYTIHNLRRCVSYQSTATALLPNQRGNAVVVGDTVMLSPGQFTITSVSIGADRDLINVTYMKNEPDCPGYPTEWYTVDIDGVQVADLTADVVQSIAINHANSSVTLFLPLLNQPLPENAVTLNMTKYNTVPTNRSNVKGNIVTEMVTWGTSAVFELSQESSPTTNDKGAVSVGGVVGAIISVLTAIIVVNTIAVALVIARKRKAKKCGTCDLKATNDPPSEVQPQGQPGCRPTPAAASQWPQPVKDTNEPLVPMTDEVDSEAVSEEQQAVGTPELESNADDQEHNSSPFGAQETDPSAGTREHPVRMIDKVDSEAASEEEAPVSVDEVDEENSNKLAKEEDSMTEERTIECHPAKDSTKAAAYVVVDGLKRIQRQPKWALTRGNPAGHVEPQETEKTICAFKNDPNTCYISGDKDIAMQGHQSVQGLTYVTVDHSQPQPINAPNENLEVQYTGVRFDTEAPAV